MKIRDRVKIKFNVITPKKASAVGVSREIRAF